MKRFLVTSAQFSDSNDNNNNPNVHNWIRTISEIVIAVIALIGFFEREELPDWLFYTSIVILLFIIILLLILSPIGKSLKSWFRGVWGNWRKNSALRKSMVDFELLVEEFGKFINPQNPTSVQKIISESSVGKSEEIRKLDENIKNIVSLIRDQYHSLKDTWLSYALKKLEMNIIRKISLEFINIINNLHRYRVLEHIYTVYDKKGDDFRESLRIFHDKLTSFCNKSNKAIKEIEIVFFPPDDWKYFMGQSYRFEIIEAIYGTPEKSIDITENLTKLVRNDKLSIAASNATAGEDPHPGVGKKLRIKYKYNDIITTREYIENARVDLP